MTEMSVMELKKAYSELPEKEQLLMESFIAASRMAKDAEFASKLSRRHDELDAGRKWTHADLLELHGKLEKEDL